MLLHGARQVGKTYLVREFGLSEYKEFIYCNFEETPALAKLFKDDLRPSIIIDLLSAYFGQSIKAESTLIFFDEIQSCQQALTSLKYFHEQAPEFHIIAAGSLLGVSIGKTSSFPVGKVNFLSLYPLNFIEFLWALKEDAMADLLRTKDSWLPIPEILHDKLSTIFKLYLYLGGMPEVVDHFIQHRDYGAARTIQKEILKAYEQDFSKYTTPTEAVRVSEVWRSLPSHLARENKKFKYSAISKGARASRFDSAIEWLRSAGLVYTAINVTRAQLPLEGYEESGHFKAYILDSGLLGAMVDVPSRAIVQDDLLFSEYNGAFVENFAATEIARKTDGRLHYWVSEGVAEVDFIIACEEKILPLEIKSGLNRNIKSLRIYAEKHGESRLYRASPRNFEARDDFANIPLYALCIFPELR